MVFGTPNSHQCRSVPEPRSLITDLAAACAGKSPNELVFTAPNGGVLWLRNWRATAKFRYPGDGSVPVGGRQVVPVRR
jgi:hypothetical protein